MSVLILCIIVVVVVVVVVIFAVYNYYENLSKRRKEKYVPPELVNELKALHDKLINEGCKDFCMPGVNEQSFVEGYCLDLRDDEWIVYYGERGGEDRPKFFYNDKEGAFKYFYELIMSQEHLHIVAFTRSLNMFNFHKNELGKYEITTIQDDIKNYKTIDDHVYRLFVKNKDIFKAKEILDKVPFYDDDLER